MLSFTLTSTVSRTLALIGMVVIAEPLAATLLFPFVYFMVQDFNVEERYIGFWAGLITSAFFIPQMLTATLWGIISDKVGRKPVMIVGLIGGAGCMLMFGLSNSLTWAILSRGFCGLFNGNAAVARTAVGELAHNAKLNQGKAFSLFGLASAIGYVVGPLVGGFLSNPWERLQIRGPLDVFITNPFLLPCFVSACFNVVICGACLLWLDETNQRLHRPELRESPEQGAEDDLTGAGAESDPLLATSQPPQKFGEDEQERGHSKSSIMYCVIGIACIAFHAIIFDEIYAIFAATRDGVGLGFSPGDIATSLSLMGPIIFIAQLILFPYLSNRFSTLTLWRASAITLAVVYPVFSLLPQLDLGESGTTKLVRWIVLLTFLTVRFSANVVAYTSITVLLNQVAPPHNRGAIMGLGQTAISLGRAAGPAVGGSIWSWSLNNSLSAPLDSHSLFLFEFFLALTQLVSSIGIEA